MRQNWDVGLWDEAGRSRTAARAMAGRVWSSVGSIRALISEPAKWEESGASSRRGFPGIVTRTGTPEKFPRLRAGGAGEFAYGRRRSYRQRVEQ